MSQASEGDEAMSKVVYKKLRAAQRHWTRERFGGARERLHWFQGDGRLPRPYMGDERQRGKRELRQLAEELLS